MISVELLLKAAAFLVSLTGLIIVILRGWRVHDRKLVSHDERLDGHDKRFDSMEEMFKDELRKMGAKFDNFANENRQSRSKLHQEINEQGKILFRLDGYMNAKKDEKA